MKKAIRLTKTQKAIFEQLSENTGRHFLDSGDHYGRNYERYKNAPNFNEGLIIDEYCGAIIPVHVFMDKNFDRSKDAVKLEKRLLKELKINGVEYVELAYYNGDEIETILKDMGATETWCGGMRWENTYNFDTDLSQTLQYMYFELNGAEYIIIETHNGCDVRGGYSKGMVYQIKDLENFVMSFKVDYEVQDDEGNWESEFNIHGAGFYVENGVMHCKETKKEIHAYVSGIELY